MEELKCILLNEISQYEKATCCTIPTLWYSGKGEAIEIVKSSESQCFPWVVEGKIDRLVQGFLG